jgi:endonuclease G
MARPGGKGSAPRAAASAGKAPGPGQAAIDAFLDGEGFSWLKVPNVVGVAVAEKEQGGRPTGQLAVKFDVVAKLPSTADVARAGSRPIPPFIKIGRHRLPTDVVEAWPEAHPAASNSPRARFDPVRGGISIGTLRETGTLGAVLWDREAGRPVALSNAHVLAGAGPNAAVFQPGPQDGGGGANDNIGRLVGTGILDRNVDAAVATIGRRGIDAGIRDLGVAVEAAVRPTRGMRVIKSGRTTEVTFGIVDNPRKLVAIDIGLPARHNIAVCVIVPDPAKPATGGLSAGGDSGSCWMLVGNDGRPTTTMVGLHVGGDGPRVAYACHADQVVARLKLEPLAGRAAVPQEVLVAGAPAAVGATVGPHRVIARDGLRIRGGPDTSFERIGSRAFGEIVNVVGSQSDWHMVDLQGDGRVDGFMLGALLEPLDG